MRDVVFVLVTIGFFALAAGYVRGCAWIIGTDEVSGPDVVDGQKADAADAEVGAR